MAGEDGAKARLLSDGLVALQAEFSETQIINLVARTARWVDRATFEILPVWFPEHARGAPRYKGNWTTAQLANKAGAVEHRRETNEAANLALTMALGLRLANRANWSCCHIWSVDDPTFQTSNSIARDHRFYTCVANMVLLPTPLKAFTDALPAVKTMLRICARNYYGWRCDHVDLSDDLDRFDAWDVYPDVWPRHQGKAPIGVLSLNDEIIERAGRRIERIRQDLRSAGPLYPRSRVLETCAYWGMDVS